MQYQETQGMENNVILIVGDRFAGFANKPGVMLASKLGQMLQQENAFEVGNGTIFIPGQGLSDEQTCKIYEEALGRGLQSSFELWGETLKMPHAGADLTHKHKSENSLIGVPRRAAEDRFEIDLMIDDRNEIMSDHVTGEHLQGMLLVEACRQAFLDVTEKFFLSQHPDYSYYFVFNDLNVSYYAFAFPLPAMIDYRILEVQSTDAQRHFFSVEMDIVQNGEVVTQVSARFTAFDAVLLKPKEQKRAAKALRQAQAGIAERCLKTIAVGDTSVTVEDRRIAA
jgi:hypothetical protein